MKKNLISAALEEAETDIPPVDEPESEEVIDGEEAEGRALSAEIETADDTIDEAESIGEVLDTNIDRVEDKVSRDEPLTEDTAKAIEVAVEHFRKRLGYEKKVVPAIEGFKSSDTSLDKTKELLVNLKEMRSALDDGLMVAQEGLFARLTNGIERWFTSADKIYQNIGPAAAELKRAGVVDGELKDAAWGRIFLKAGKQIDASKVSGLIAEIRKQQHDSLPILRQISDLAIDIGNSIRNNNSISRDKDVQEIKRLQGIAEKLLAEIKTKIEVYSKGSVDAKPLSEQEADKLHKEVRTLMEDQPFKKEVAHFRSVIGVNGFSYYNQKKWRVNGILAGDLRAYSDAMGAAIHPAFSLVNGLAQAEYLIAYGVYKYIKASTK